MSREHRLTVFVRRGCHLCDALLDELAPLCAGRAAVAVVDVDGDATLTSRYALVPLVEGTRGEELSRFFLDSHRIESYLAS